MDLRSLCSKLDMDALRAKIPPLPQIKLPKSMSKLRSRKIFRSSREDVNSAPRRASSKRGPNNSETLTLHLGPPSEAINRTPNRISTISSLMNQRGDGSRVSNKWKSKNNDDEEHFYRSAGSIDDYFASPRNPRIDQIISRPISPIRAPPITQEFRTQSEQNIKMSFGERLHKSYKDVTEFKLKHLFAKKTVVRTDKIEINEYIHRFDEDRQHEERVKEKMYREVAEDYRFQFRVSQQKSEESYAESPASSPIHHRALKKNQKTVSELSGDESGMELSPPPRRPGIASTRFSRVRHTPLNMSLEEDNDDGDGIHVVEDKPAHKSQPPSQNFKSTRASIKLSQMRYTSVNRSITESRDEEDNESSDDYELDVKDEYSPKIRPNASSLSANKKQEKPTPEKSSPRKSKSIKERMSRFAKQRSEGDEKKRRAPLTPQQSEENEETTKSDKPFEAIKQNLKRLQKSIKLPQHAQPSADAENENEETNPENKTIFSKTQQFAERLKRFRSTDHIDKNTEEDDNKESPIHKISNRLQEWKKSIRKKVDLHSTDNDDDYAGGSPQKPVGALMMKLKHIRSRKHDSVDDPDDDEEGGETYKESLAARAKLQLEKGVVAASQVPQRTIKKISETKKYFRKKHENDVKKSQSEEENDDEEEQVKQSPKSIPRPPPPRPPSIPRPHFSNSSEEDTDNREAFIAKSITESQLIAVPAARAVWTTRPILSDDTTDYDDELPRILLHQDNSDIFESTLIIAVTRPISRATTPIITELPPDSTEESGETGTKLDTWNPNQEKAETGSEITPPTIRKLSKDSHTTSSSRGHSRKDSIESSSDDSWIKDIPRGPSIAVLNSVSENEEPWRIIQAKPENNLYKTKSIDLFELQKKHGGVLTAFEDFDDELKNTPVVKIANEQPLQQNISLSLDNSERESSEELENPYDDNSSRITEISVHPPNITISENANIKSEIKPHSLGNSCESLTANFDDEDVIDSSEKYDNEESLDSKEEVFKDIKMQHDRPPSKTPSPPPSKSPTPSTTSKSPTPPPLPQRQPSIRLSKLSQPSLDIVCPSEPPPPLPLTKPPIPPNRPAAPSPKIPDRDPSITRASRPLVKTASLRLAYSEQVSPQDVGKVNKLISRFEPGGPSQRPRIVPRKAWFTSESEEYSDEEDILELLPTKSTEKARDATPTNYSRIQKSFSIDSVNLPNNNENLNPPPSREIQTSLTRKATSQVVLDNSERATPIPSISISSTCLDVNSNFSQPSSVYGSPLPYPASLVGSTEVTPTTIRKESEHLATRRNRRSLVRDDERFYSFDSDEENSYYSISSTNSNRYIVEL